MFTARSCSGYAWWLLVCPLSPITRFAFLFFLFFGFSLLNSLQFISLEPFSLLCFCIINVSGVRGVPIFAYEKLIYVGMSLSNALRPMMMVYSKLDLAKKLIWLLLPSSSKIYRVMTKSWLNIRETSHITAEEFNPYQCHSSTVF